MSVYPSIYLSILCFHYCYCIFYVCSFFLSFFLSFFFLSFLFFVSGVLSFSSSLNQGGTAKDGRSARLFRGSGITREDIPCVTWEGFVGRSAARMMLGSLPNLRYPEWKVKPCTLLAGYQTWLRWLFYGIADSISACGYGSKSNHPVTAGSILGTYFWLTAMWLTYSLSPFFDLCFHLPRFDRRTSPTEPIVEPGARGFRRSLGGRDDATKMMRIKAGSLVQHRQPLPTTVLFSFVLGLMTLVAT